MLVDKTKFTNGGNENVSYKYRYLTKLWWKRRLDYHNYTKLYCDKNESI